VNRPLRRVFLDANVLFSAAYVPDSRLFGLWSLGDTELVTSDFALEEARRNVLVYRPEGIPLLEKLSARVTITSGVPARDLLPDGIELAEKDRPIVAAAIAAGCTHLLTGDRRHFRALYGREVQGVLVLTPAEYLHARRGRG